MLPKASRFLGKWASEVENRLGNSAHIPARGSLQFVDHSSRKSWGFSLPLCMVLLRFVQGCRNWKLSFSLSLLIFIIVSVSLFLIHDLSRHQPAHRSNLKQNNQSYYELQALQAYLEQLRTLWLTPGVSQLPTAEDYFMRTSWALQSQEDFNTKAFSALILNLTDIISDEKNVLFRYVSVLLVRLYHSWDKKKSESFPNSATWNSTCWEHSQLYSSSMKAALSPAPLDPL